MGGDPEKALLCTGEKFLQPVHEAGPMGPSDTPAWIAIRGGATELCDETDPHPATGQARVSLLAVAKKQGQRGGK